MQGLESPTEPKRLLSKVPRIREFWFLMLSMGVTGLASNAISPYLPVFLYKQLGISVGAVSFLYFASGILGTLSVFFMGWLVDRFGRKKIFAFGSSSAAILPAALTQLSSYNRILPLISLTGIMGSASNTSQTAIIADQVEEGKRNTAYGISRIVGNMSWIVAPIVGGLFLAAHGFHPLFVISAIVAAIGLVLFIGLVPESRKKNLQRPSLPKVSVLRDRDLLVLCIASLFSMMFYTQFYSLLPIFATQVKGLTDLEIGLLFSASGATVVALQFPTSRWLDRFPKRTGYIIGVVILALGITSIALAPNFNWLLVSVVLMTIGENIFFPIASTLVTEIAPEAELGMYVGAFGLFLSIGGNISPLLGGTVWQLTGDPYLPWLLSPIYAGISVGFALAFRKTKRQTQKIEDTMKS
jgi:MFS family permease